jgi:hypothetical protein
MVEPRGGDARLFVEAAMQTFRILYFRENVLEHAEEIRVRDVLEAIEKASGKPAGLRAEVWSERGRVGEIGTSPALDPRNREL